jgi:hypothetical protein
VVDLKFIFFYFAINQNGSRVYENVTSQVGRHPGCTRSQCKETGLDDLDP